MNSPSDEQALSLGLSLARAQASLQQLLGERLGTWHGLSPADFLLLDVLAEAPPGGLCPRDLAKALHLAPSALVRQLMPLHKTGLLAREAGTVQLRPAGRRLHAEAAQTAGAACRQVSVAAGLDGADGGALAARLDALARGAARAAQGASAA